MEDCTPGYSRTAAFLSSETNFSLYRGFSYLYSRVLLAIQDDIVILERELEDLDKEHQTNKQHVRLQSREQDMRISRRGGDNGSRDRQSIIADISSKLEIYGKTMKQARDLAAFQRPSKRDYQSVRTWFWNTAPLVEKEREFIMHKEDIVSLHNGREWSTFDGIVEQLLMNLNSKVIKVSDRYYRW